MRRWSAQPLMPSPPLLSSFVPYHAGHFFNRAARIGCSLGCQEQCASHPRPSPSPLSRLCLNVLSSGRSSWTPRCGSCVGCLHSGLLVLFLPGTPLFLVIALFAPLFGSCLCPPPSHPRVVYRTRGWVQAGPPHLGLCSV